MDTLERDLDITIDQTLGGYRAVDETLAGLNPPDRDLAEGAAKHLEEAIAQERRALRAEKAGAAAVTELLDEKCRLEQAHREAMARIDADVASIQARTTGEVATAVRLAGASRAALRALSR